MNLTFRRAENVVIFRLQGDVIGEDGRTLRAAIERVIELGGEKVQLLIDLYDTGMIDSSGLGALIYAHEKIVREGGGRLGVMRVNAHVSQLLRLAKLGSLLEHFPNEETALRYITL